MRYPVTTLRPDEHGNLVPVATVRTPRAAAVVRSGPFVVWDDLCQATRAGDTLPECAAYLAQGVVRGEEVCFMSARGPRQLNRAEQRELRRLTEEYTS